MTESGIPPSGRMAVDSKKCEPDDPMELVGVEIPAGSEAVMLEMASVFAEEFVRMGWPEESILGLFRNPYYAAVHNIWLARGEDEVRRIVRQAIDLWRPPVPDRRG